MICVECCSDLDTVYRFHERIRRSKYILLNYITKLSSVSETSGILNVCLKHFQPKSNEQFEKITDSIEDVITEFANSYIITNDTCVNNGDSNNLLQEKETVKCGVTVNDLNVVYNNTGIITV